MSRLFVMDGKLAVFLNKMADLVILNLLWLVCCIPVVTAGAATTAFAYELLKLARDEESYVFTGFFRQFKENFRQSTIVWLVYLLIGMVVYFDIRALGMMDLPGKPVLTMVLYIAAFLALASMFYAFPIMAFFRNSVKKVFRNSLLMSIAHLPWTLLIILINLCPVFFLLFGNAIAACFVDVVIGFCLAGWANAHIFRRLFDRYTKGAETNGEKV